MTVNELAAMLTKEAGGHVARAAKAMSEERQTWRPLESGRSPVDQVAECSAANEFAAVTLREFIPPTFNKESLDGRKAELDAMPKALAALRASTDDLLAAIGEFPADRLEEMVDLPMAPGLRKPFAWVMMLGYWNMIYHWGQINYIQTLYGDWEMH